MERSFRRSDPLGSFGESNDPAPVRSEDHLGFSSRGPSDVSMDSPARRMTPHQPARPSTPTDVVPHVNVEETPAVPAGEPPVAASLPSASANPSLPISSEPRPRVFTRAWQAIREASNQIRNAPSVREPVGVFSGEVIRQSGLGYGTFVLGEGVNAIAEYSLGRETTGWEHLGITSTTMTTASIAMDLICRYGLRRIPFSAIRPSLINNMRMMPAGMANMLPIGVAVGLSSYLVGINPDSRIGRWGGMAVTTILGSLSMNATLAGGATAASIVESGGLLAGIGVGVRVGGGVAISLLAGILWGHFVVDPLVGWAGNHVLDAVAGGEENLPWYLQNDGSLSDILSGFIYAGMHSVEALTGNLESGVGRGQNSTRFFEQRILLPACDFLGIG